MIMNGKGVPRIVDKRFHLTFILFGFSEMGECYALNISHEVTGKLN